MQQKAAAAATMDEARATLERVFGHRGFIGKQEEVLRQVLGGGSALALMPTGGGKSLCYQLPALVRPGTTVVVSPLIALMKDQVDGLAQYDIRAAYLNSSQTLTQNREAKDKLTAGKLDLLYISPERLMSGDGLDIIHSAPLSLIAIDEAHCISQWGHDFRPEYLQLGRLAGEFPQVPRLALTATADEQTRREIIEKLHLQDAQITIASFDRVNIRYRVRPKAGTRDQFLKFYRNEHAGQSGIIYCLSRRRTEETAEWLEGEGIRALPYHAGMTAKVRQSHQESFLHEDGMIVCATVAFGMGINKPDVRFVAHFDLPKSIEGYYQETGRAGRDGLPANALLFYGYGDVHNVRKMIDDGNSPEHIRRIEHGKLDALVAFCDGATCRRAHLLNYFGEEYKPPCDNCDNCIVPPKTEDVTVAAQKLLSAAHRTGQLFGIGHLVDVLMGNRTEKVEKFKHDQLPTFGVGADKTPPQWRNIGNQLISQGFLLRDGEYGSLKITPSGRELLRGERKVEIREQLQRERTRSRGERPARTQPASILDEWQMEVFEALREERRRLADAQNVPAYVVFHDNVLIEMAKNMPKSKDALAAIPGIGAAKVERYAKRFLKVLLGMKK